ncbi:MAG TPA: glycosyltransferase family 2 protein [Hellea balneolensis]|uniref:Glycosyltransferase family 2 protein n=1 Tax=Hellea balneolensis TaxID=287478 RepID=A0A7C5LWC0_9PROT|nr:glycosyltransferase family 2 protein [Hellea balneolensis]
MPKTTKNITYSVVVPVFNEQDNVAPLAGEIAQAMHGYAYEMIFIDDHSTDDTLKTLESLKTEFPTLRVLHHRENSGQSRSVRSGILAAKGTIIATLDGDGQNNPADIPAMIAQISRDDAPENLALVGGRRAKRKDSWAKRVASRFGNGVRKWLLKDEADDTGCGLKVFTREAFLRLPYFDHIHRYIPALMLREGYAIEFCDVSHRGRLHGVSKYTNFGRLVVSIADLRGVMWLRRRARLPGQVDEI